jgi:hypothetical protein
MINVKPARAIAVAAAVVALATVFVAGAANVADAQGYYVPTELQHWYDRGYPGG